MVGEGTVTEETGEVLWHARASFQSCPTSDCYIQGTESGRKDTRDPVAGEELKWTPKADPQPTFGKQRWAPPPVHFWQAKVGPKADP